MHVIFPAASHRRIVRVHTPIIDAAMHESAGILIPLLRGTRRAPFNAPGSSPHALFSTILLQNVSNPYCLAVPPYIDQSRILHLQGHMGYIEFALSAISTIELLTATVARG
jgi:hypothetical protein